MRLETAGSAILSAVVFNALVIVAVVPLALRGVKYAPASAADMLRRNLLVCGLGGLVAPFVGIKLIDLVRGNLARDWTLMARQVLPGLRALVALTVLLGLVYPLAMTGVATVVFPDNAEGSYVEVEGAVVGSDLLGRSFVSPQTGAPLAQCF